MDESDIPKVGFIYDELMTKHEHYTICDHPERPSRITKSFKMLKDAGYIEKCINLETRIANKSELAKVHELDYIEEVERYKFSEDVNQCKLPEKWPTYMSDGTYEAAACAVGCALNLVDAVMTGEVESGVALIRPPGHHAEVNESSGFCFFNNVALAAKHARDVHAAKRVLILDWDIHHGNGIQHIFYNDSSVLYISLHRFDNGDYFPGLREASHEAVGSGNGEGFNVNIPWNRDLMGNSEYKAAFDLIVLPISNQYQPNLVLISAGFDAAAADPIGEYILTPEMYGYMTEKLMSLASGKVLVILEGGYNEKSIGESMISCLKSLFRERTVTEESLNLTEPCKRGLQTLSSVIETQTKYWKL